MKLLDHPNIIRLHEVLEGPDHVFIVMEYAPGGEMIDFVIAHGKLQEKLARQFFRQIVYAIDYCHSLHVIRMSSHSIFLVFRMLLSYQQ